MSLIGEGMSLIGEGLRGQRMIRSINILFADDVCTLITKVERAGLVKVMKYNNGDFNFQTKKNYTLKMKFTQWGTKDATGICTCAVKLLKSN